MIIFRNSVNLPGLALSTYVKDVAMNRSTFDLDLHMCACIMDAQGARLSRRERERRNGALESAEEKHGWRGAEYTKLCDLHGLVLSEKLYNAEGRRIPRRVYVRTYVRPRTYTFVRPHMRCYEQ